MMRSRFSFVVLCALVMSACASSAPSAPPVTPQLSAPDPAQIAAVKAEREAATKVYVSCLVRAAKRLDDHKSDPATIAQAMLSACAVEWNQQINVYSRGGLDREIVARTAGENRLGEAIQIVLQNRKNGFK